MKVVQIGDPVLRQVAPEVPVSEIESDKIQGVIADMKAAMIESGITRYSNSISTPVAIAAPQIGHSHRIFIIRTDVLNRDRDWEEDEKREAQFQVYINPKIIKRSRKQDFIDEGCMSVEGRFGLIKRARQATVEAYDERGNKFQAGGSGLLAQIFQHEIDHLDGILFVDSAKGVRDYRELDHEEE